MNQTAPIDASGEETCKKEDEGAPGCDVYPFPPGRNLVVDAGHMASKRHIVYGLDEVDVTEAQQLRRDYEETTGTKLSFTAFLVASLGRAVAANPKVQAYRDSSRWGKPLVAFHDVDVVTMIEPAKDRGAVAIPHVVRTAQTKSVLEITQEIRNVQTTPTSSKQGGGRLISIAPHLPRFLRLGFFSWAKRRPERLKMYQGTVILTSVGMFGGAGSGWGVTFLPAHTLGITVGSISKKPGVVDDDQIAVREFLNLTISLDHDVVDGAPAARFVKAFLELIKSAAVLKEEPCETNLTEPQAES